MGLQGDHFVYCILTDQSNTLQSQNLNPHPRLPTPWDTSLANSFSNLRSWSLKRKVHMASPECSKQRLSAFSDKALSVKGEPCETVWMWPPFFPFNRNFVLHFFAWSWPFKMQWIALLVKCLCFSSVVFLIANFPDLSKAYDVSKDQKFKAGAQSIQCLPCKHVQIPSAHRKGWVCVSVIPALWTRWQKDP